MILFSAYPSFFHSNNESEFSAAATQNCQLATPHCLCKGLHLLPCTGCCSLSVPLMPSSAQTAIQTSTAIQVDSSRGADFSR